jgi:hypothetical protein
MPGWYLDAPDPHPNELFYFEAFNALSSCRQFGMQLGPIPWRDVVAYGSMLGLEGEALDGFVYVIDEMDDEYMEWQRSEAERERRASERSERNE